MTLQDHIEVTSVWAGVVVRGLRPVALVRVRAVGKSVDAEWRNPHVPRGRARANDNGRAATSRAVTSGSAAHEP